MPKIEAFQKYADEYDNWFVTNFYAFLSELKAIKKLIPNVDGVIEIGIGSGVFAKPLGIHEGIEPSEAMRNKAKKNGLKVFDAVAEKLPYDNLSLNGVVMITSICFVDDVYQSFREAYRVLKKDGFLILAFVDKDSTVGKEYLKHKNKSMFYKDASFFSSKELYEILQQCGFEVSETCQTIFGKVVDIKEIQTVREGFGDGSFVVIKAKKNYGRHI